jgi:hypothetical protein
MAKASFLDSFLLFLSVSITSSSARSEEKEKGKKGEGGKVISKKK